MPTPGTPVLPRDRKCPAENGVSLHDFAAAEEDERKTNRHPREVDVRGRKFSHCSRPGLSVERLGFRKFASIGQYVRECRFFEINVTVLVADPRAMNSDGLAQECRSGRIAQCMSHANKQD